MNFHKRIDRTRQALSHVAAWGIIPVYLAGVGGTIWLEDRLGIPIMLVNVILMASFGAYAVVGSLLVARYPENPVSWIFIAIGAIVSLFPTAETYTAYVMTRRGSPDFLAVFGAWGNGVYWPILLALALIYLPMLFPDGRLPSRRWVPLLVIPSISLVGCMIIGAFSETLKGQNIAYQIHNPIGIPGMPPLEEHPLFPVLEIGLLIGLLGAIAAVYTRFRRSNGIERQQIKWFLLAVALTPTTFLSNFLPSILSNFVFGLVIISLPVAIGVAVMRYHLFDIDLIIRRTILYSLLSILLALVYFGLVVILEQAFRVFSGENSPLAMVLSTLAIAALFNPLRHRIQTVIDRQFFRGRYNTEQILAQFSANLQNEVDEETLHRHLLDAISKYIQPESLGLWIRKG